MTETTGRGRLHPRGQGVADHRGQRQAYTAARDRIRAEYLFSREHRPPTTGRGIHHVALISKDVETTVEWYQNVAGFPLTVLFENRDLAGSSHFFFDVGNGNSLAFFDLPGGRARAVRRGAGRAAPPRDLGARAAVARDPGAAGRAKIAVRRPLRVVDLHGDPDGARIEFLYDPLGEMYGKPTT